MTVSVLDDVPGLGPARRQALLRQFGSVRRLQAATVEQIGAVPGIGPGIAAAVVRAVAGQGPADVAAADLRG